MRALKTLDDTDTMHAERLYPEILIFLFYIKENIDIQYFLLLLLLSEYNERESQKYTRVIRNVGITL